MNMKKFLNGRLIVTFSESTTDCACNIILIEIAIKLQVLLKIVY